MSALSELNTIISAIPLSVETGVFSGVAPDEYVVLTPLTDSFALHADNRPHADVQEVRLSLFTKGNYRMRKSQLEAALLAADFTVTERRYVGFEDDTKYFSYAIDAAKTYDLEGI
jgi:hypothetical protein